MFFINLIDYAKHFHKKIGRNHPDALISYKFYVIVFNLPIIKQIMLRFRIRVFVVFCVGEGLSSRFVLCYPYVCWIDYYSVLVIGVVETV